MWPLETLVRMNEEADSKYQASQECWHSVDHCLPVNNRDVLLFDGENYYVGFLERAKFYDSTGIYHLESIIHWRELPAPPR